MSNKYTQENDSQDDEMSLKELIDSLFPQDKNPPKNIVKEESSKNVTIKFSLFKKLMFLEKFEAKKYQAPKKIKIKI